MAIELTTASSGTISSIRETLSASSTEQFRQSLGDSGDGNGYNTLQLHPDSSRSASDQYIVIDPTAPGHIHIRAGGTADSSGAELYLGAEKNYVRVIDNQGIRIQNETADLNNHFFVPPNGFTSGIWYTSGGNHFLQLSSTDNTFTGFLEAFTDGAPNYIQFWSPGIGPTNLTYVPGTYSQVGNIYTFQVNEGHGLGEEQIAEEIVFGIYTSVINHLRLENNDFRVDVNDDIRMFGKDFFLFANYSTDTGIQIATNYDTEQEHRWIFNADGKLTLPGDSAQIVVEEGGVRIGNGDLNSAPSSHIGVGGPSGHAFEIFGGPPGYSYKFDKKNTLTLPASGTLSADGGVFNGGHLQFIGGASGDGYGYSTIELHPDNTRSEYDQYIIIDPTAGEPPHIHIRAGGQQDSSGAVLFLGGENSHVKVGAGANPPITIASNNNNFIFNSDGYLIFPDGGALKYRNSVPTSSVGAPGDVEGTVVIASGYIYYCTANYGGTQYNVQSILPGDGDQSGYLVPNSYQLPQVGWKVYYNGQERTIEQVNDGGNPGYYTVFVDSALEIPANTTFQWGPAPVENIWKRVAFSNDTW